MRVLTKDRNKTYQTGFYSVTWSPNVICVAEVELINEGNQSMSKPYIQWRAVFRYLPLPPPPQSYLYVMYITYLLTSQSKSQCEDIFLPAITFRYHSFNMTYVLSKDIYRYQTLYA